MVRAWIYASDQRFNLDSRQVAALAGTDLPISVLQALAGLAEYGGAPYLSPNRDNDVYMNSSSVYVAPQVAQAPFYDSNPGYPCSPLNCPYTPYSAYNSFGFPFGFPVSFVTTTRNNGINRQPFRGKPSHGGNWGSGFQGGGRRGGGTGRPAGGGTGRSAGGGAGRR